MDCPVTRAEYFRCFETNENLRNDNIKDVTENILLILESVYLHCGQQTQAPYPMDNKYGGDIITGVQINTIIQERSLSFEHGD